MAVLMFDGLMVKKSRTPEEDLRILLAALEEAAYQATLARGIGVRISCS